MPSKSFAPHIQQLLDNVQEVETLLNIHRAIAGSDAGRKRNVEVLNKSAVVLTVACWEAFVEDLASAALNFMIKEATTHSVFPTPVLERIGSKYSGIKAWSLANDGWKKALRDNYAEILAKTTGALNTPRTSQVDELFAKTIGLTNLSSHWSWIGRSQSSASKALDDLITLRGGIAHRVKHSESIQKKHVIAAVELISRLAAKSTNQVRAYVHTKTGKYPWDHATYKGVG